MHNLGHIQPSATCSMDYSGMWEGNGLPVTTDPKNRTMEEACIVLLDSLLALGTKEDGNASQFLSLME